MNKIELKKISSDSLNNIYCDEIIKEPSLKQFLTRRKLFKLSGMTIFGISVAGLSNVILSNKANAQCFDYYGNNYCNPYYVWYYQMYQQQMYAQYGALIQAQFQALYLANQQWSVGQPISGKVSVINDKNKPVSGNLSLTLVDSRSLNQLEDYKIGKYTMPPNRIETYQFNGIVGKYPGNKKLSTWTENDQTSTDLSIYA